MGLDKNKQPSPPSGGLAWPTQSAAPRFSVGLALTNRHHSFILKIQEFFNGEGYISAYGAESRVTFANIETVLKVIIPHFDKYPLISNKSVDYRLFRDGFFIIQSGAYKTTEGLLLFSQICSAINTGPKLSILRHFFDITPAPRPALAAPPSSLDPWWITGFIEGDGGFTASIKYRENSFRVQPFFGITQHSRDELLITTIKNYFSVGGIYSKKGAKGRNYIQYAISSYKDILKVITPRYARPPLQSPKLEVYKLWLELNILLAKGRNKTELDKQKTIELVSNIHKLNSPIKIPSGREVKDGPIS